MKKYGVLGVMTLAVLLTFLIGFAGISNGMDHKKMGKGMMMKEKKGDKKLLSVEKDGYTFDFDFIDLKEKMPDMDMGGMTHHLMVFVKDGSGNAVTGAKVKYKLFAPSGKETEAMPMFMGGGYGADVSLSEKGKYGIACLVKDGDKKVLVKISHEVK